MSGDDDFYPICANATTTTTTVTFSSTNDYLFLSYHFWGYKNSPRNGYSISKLHSLAPDLIIKLHIYCSKYLMPDIFDCCHMHFSSFILRQMM